MAVLPFHSGMRLFHSVGLVAAGSCAKASCADFGRLTPQEELSAPIYEPLAAEISELAAAAPALLEPHCCKVVADRHS